MATSKRKAEYNKKWMAAARALKRMRQNENNSSDDDDDDGDINNAPTNQDEVPIVGDIKLPDNDRIHGQHYQIPQQNPIAVLDDLPPQLPPNHFEHSDSDSEDSIEDQWNWDFIDQERVVTSESEDGLDSEGDNDQFADNLASWTSKFLVKHNAVDELLKLLQRSGHPHLPATARTLLQTPKNIETSELSGMQYVYFGLKEQLLNAFKKYPQNVQENVRDIELSFNVDGIPLHKSSGKSLWPILCAIMNMEVVQVFPVALTYGKSKPTNLEFLNETIQDLNDLLTNGFKVKVVNTEKTIPVLIKCIVCDAPALAFVKEIKSFSGYYGCSKCNQRGVWVGRMTYQNVTSFECRTDTSFRLKSNEGHHLRPAVGQQQQLRISPFCDLAIDMVKCFPVDYMHQSCLGVMRRLIRIWTKGMLAIRMSATQRERVSRKLMSLQKSIPACFARKPRSLTEVDRWKATEYRQFLLYTGKICLEGILRQELFDHFMVLSYATCILIAPKLAQTYNNYAHQLMLYFNEQGRVLYGDEFLVYNVHSMVHLAAEAKEFGSLDNCAAFPFENYLQHLKKLVRSGKNPLVQIAKRLAENSGARTIMVPHHHKISTAEPNNAFILSNSSCAEVIGKAHGNNEDDGDKYLCRVYRRSEAAYDSPCDSRIIGVHRVHNRNASMKVVPEADLVRKALKFTVADDEAVFMGILHKL